MESTFLIDTPHVHIHYLIDDELADIQGYAETELCCHACGKYIRVLYNLPKEGDPIYEEIKDNGLPQLALIRDDFEAKHKNCVPAMKKVPLIGFVVGEGTNQFKFLCPSWRKYGYPEEKIDLRTNKQQHEM